MMMINPNDESTLTSVSGNTPVPTDNGAVESSDDDVLMKFPPIYAEDDNMMSDSFAQEHSYHTELTGSISDSNTSRDDTDDSQADSTCLVPEEVTCHDDISLSDKSFEAPSPIICRRSSPQEELLEQTTVDDQQKANSGSADTDSQDQQRQKSEFVSLRITYLIVTLVIMLADGLQGTI